MPAFAEVAGTVVRTGKRKVKEDDRNLRMARYAPKRALPKLRPSVVRSPKVALLLPRGWGMMANDDYGDCTCASFGHMEQVWTGIATPTVPPWTATDQQVLALYDRVNGGKDEGAQMLDVLNEMRTRGIGGRKIRAFIQIAVSNTDHLKYAIDEFGSAYLGLQLPKSAQTQIRWTVTSGPKSKPGSWGGHAVNLLDYDSTGAACVTWGAVVQMSWNFIRTYADEAYAIISPDWLTGGKSPRGFDMTKLQQDLSGLT
jgi:hypothetical protein